MILHYQNNKHNKVLYKLKVKVKSKKMNKLSNKFKKLGILFINMKKSKNNYFNK